LFEKWNNDNQVVLYLDKNLCNLKLPQVCRYKNSTTGTTEEEDESKRKKKMKILRLTTPL